ncbi:MAG: ABC transporter permease [Planctomycetota bacterium]
MYKFFLTWRYMSRRVLSLVAIFVLALAVAVLVVAPSIMSGFQEEFHKRLRGTLSDLIYYGSIPFSVSDDPRIRQGLEALDNVQAAAPYLENPAIDKHLKKMDYCFLRGIHPEQEARVSKIRDQFISERKAYKETHDYRTATSDEKVEIDLVANELSDEVDVDGIFKKLDQGDPADPGLPTCVVGVYYMKRWSLLVGDTIRLTTASDEGEIEQDKKFKIVGVFQAGHHETDRRLVVMGLKSLQDFIKVPGRVTGWSLKLVDYQQAEATKREVIEAIRFGPLRDVALRDEATGFFIQSWEERNKNLLEAVKMERLLIKLMTVLVVLAASASIFLVLFMTVYSKVRELGILRAIGASRSGVLALFVGQGFLIALAGMVAGLALGYWFGMNINEIAAWQQQYTGWHPFPPEVYHLDRIPVKFSLEETLGNFGLTLLLGSAAAVVPGTIAALKPPLKAIRYE